MVALTVYSVGYDHDNSSSDSEQLARQLHQAVKDGDVNRVKDLLGQGVYMNHELYQTEEWMWEYPPLHRACVMGNLEIVKTLINAGADVDEVVRWANKTPLHYACEGGNQQLVDYLVREAGCKVGESILYVHSRYNRTGS